MKQYTQTNRGTQGDLIALLLLLFFVISSPRAQAYVDPSTGSYVVEISAAAIFTLLYSVKWLFKELKRRLLSLSFHPGRE